MTKISLGLAVLVSFISGAILYGTLYDVVAKVSPVHAKILIICVLMQFVSNVLIKINMPGNR